jgi:mono/diheme cytochrome c family protein
MVAVTALVLVFIATGIAVVAAAFAGRGKPGSEPASRSGNRLIYTGIALIVLGLGIAVPTLIMADNAEEAESHAIGGVDLTASQTAGRELFAENCANCHTLLASNAVGKIGPSLDVLRPPAALVENAVIQGRANGRGNMPAALLTGQDAKDVAAYVEAVAGRPQP